jgi:cytochrome c biogenesis protein CcmG/thiol:disulfide interchange protein DsbE
MQNIKDFARHFCAFVLIGIASSAFASAEETPLDLAQYEGQVVVVDFWASWCVPCRRSFPWLNDMHDKYQREGLVIIGVNLDQERGEAEAFLQEFPADFRIHFDETKDLAREFDVVAMPSSYLIGRDGQVVKRHFGFKVNQQDEYEAAIIAALGE